MFTYESLSRCPRVFRSLTGMNPAQFESLLTDFHAAAERLRGRSSTTRQGQPRQRAAGAGHPFRHDHRHRLLMALVWLRIYPTYELLGFFFGLHKRNAQLNVRAVLEVLDTLDDFPFDHPGHDRRKRQTGLLGCLADGEGAMVDKGYVGIDKDYPAVPLVMPFKAWRNHPLTDEQKAFNRVVARYRIVVEHALAQLDRFPVLRQVFRGRCWRHGTAHSQVVRVVAALVNRRIGVCPLKTYAWAG